jgi:hypothetical protein
MKPQREDFAQGKAPAEIVRTLTHALRKACYPETLGPGADEKPFYRDLRFLQLAATTPAAWLAARGARLPWRRYEELFRTQILQPIALHGTLPPIEQSGARGRYLLHCAQQHMSHHGEEYLDQAKAIERAVSDVIHGLSRKAVATDDTTASLATLHEGLRLKSGRKKAPATPARAPKPAREIQSELF